MGDNSFTTIYSKQKPKCGHYVGAQSHLYPLTAQDNKYLGINIVLIIIKIKSIEKSLLICNK